MVKDTRKAESAGAVRALNSPIPVRVETANSALPVALKRHSKWLKVEAITDCWRIDDEWWREQPISRIYYRCVMDQGSRITIFQDFYTCEWYRQIV